MIDDIDSREDYKDSHDSCDGIWRVRSSRQAASFL